MDLLLYFIRRDEVNIYDIPIAKIAEEYLEYIEMMRTLDLQIAGEFVEMASTLMQIKSRMLIPRRRLLKRNRASLELIRFAFCKLDLLGRKACFLRA